jgi:hypothetical protein
MGNYGTTLFTPGRASINNEQQSLLLLLLHKHHDGITFSGAKQKTQHLQERRFASAVFFAGDNGFLPLVSQS